MPRLSPEDALKKAEQDKAEAERRLKEARAKISKKQRAEDTRRKVIIGAMILADVEKNPSLARYLYSHLVNMSKRDRALFPDLENPPPRTDK